MKKYSGKLSIFILTFLFGVAFLPCFYGNASIAGGLHKRVEKSGGGLNKDHTFSLRVDAEAGALNTVLITKDAGENPIKLDKAYLFVHNGLNAGNIHLHNLVVDGKFLLNFGMGELNFVMAGSGGTATVNPRGAELTKIISDVMNTDGLEILANKSIEFDFMAAPMNDPLPSPVGLIINVKSDAGSEVSVKMVDN